MTAAFRTPLAMAPTDRRTHCPYCAYQCGIIYDDATGAEDVRVFGDPNFPVNNGQLCIKGWTSAALLRHPARLTTPLLRSAGGKLEPTDWDTALDFIAGKFIRIRQESGPDANAVFGSGALTNEKAYLLGKFARVALGTSQIDYNGRFCMSSAAAGQNRAFGIDRGLPFPVADIADAEVVLLMGANAADTLPPLMQWFDRQRANGGKLVVADPRRTATAKAADVFVQLTPGSDLAFANGLLFVALEENLIDRAYIAARTTGFDAVRGVALTYHPAHVERLTGVGEATLRQVARMLAAARSAMLLSGRGPEQQSKGVDTVHSFINLMLALGKVGKPASGYGCLTGQGNGQGGREHGQKADQLPGYRLIENDAHREAVARVWGVPPASLPRKGKSAFELLDSLGPLSPSQSPSLLTSPRVGEVAAQRRVGGRGLPSPPEGEGGGAAPPGEGNSSKGIPLTRASPGDACPLPQGERGEVPPTLTLPRKGGGDQTGGIRGLLVMGSNVAVASPHAARILGRLKSLDLLAVCDSFVNETAELAHVVLPVYQWAEEEGTMTNLEGRVIRRRVVARPPAGVRGDIDVLRILADRLGCGEKFAFHTPREVFAEFRRCTAGAPADYSGISYEKIDAADGIHWPCSDESHPGTPRLFAERFHHPDGKAKFFPVEHRPAGEEPDAAFPLYFTTGRYKEHYNSGAQTRGVVKLLTAQPAPRLELHPRLAKRHGIVTGHVVTVETRRGRAEFAAEITPDIRPDTLFAPFHWGGKGAANLLTSTALDPVSRMPEFKFAAARIAGVRSSP